jgi:hypothetical protein
MFFGKRNGLRLEVDGVLFNSSVVVVNEVKAAAVEAHVKELLEIVEDFKKYNDAV